MGTVGLGRSADIHMRVARVEEPTRCRDASRRERKSPVAMTKQSKNENRESGVINSHNVS